jgi:ATPase family associated with various cellular activities (AAA)
VTEDEEPEPGTVLVDIPADEETGLRVGRVTLFGPSGSGKTLFAAALVPQMQQSSDEQLYVLSPVATAANKLTARGLKPQWYQIDPGDKKSVEAFMAEMKKKRAMLIVDEADSYFGGSGRTFGTPSMFSAVNFGRNNCLSMIMIAHGTNVAPKNLIENSSLVGFFRTTSNNLLKWAEEYLQDDVPDPRYVLKSLPPHVALLYAPQQTPRMVGSAKVNLATGEIGVKPWSHTQDLSQTSEPNMERPMSDGTVPGADESSGIAGTPASVPGASRTT